MSWRPSPGGPKEPVDLPGPFCPHDIDIARPCGACAASDRRHRFIDRWLIVIVLAGMSGCFALFWALNKYLAH